MKEMLDFQAMLADLDAHSELDVLLAADDIEERRKAKAAHLWARDGLDWYVEGEECTRALLRSERFIGAILDPTCGGGNVVRAARSVGHAAVGTDIKRRTEEDFFIGEADFLTVRHIAQPNIIMNPPFFRAVGNEQFARRALSLATSKVAVFADLKFLAGGKRAAGFYAQHPPSRIYILTPRPSCPPGEYLRAGNKAGGGTADWVWLVWDLTAPRAAPTFHWLSTKGERSE